MASFKLKLREVALSNIQQSDVFLNTATGRMQLIYIEWIAVRYKYKVFKATLSICRKLLLYILCATYSIRLGNWARYSITVLIAQKNSYDFIPKVYILRVLGSIPCHKRLKTK
jgi:hypothetical protein